jgi:hypothetical protein
MQVVARPLPNKSLKEFIHLFMEPYQIKLNEKAILVEITEFFGDFVDGSDELRYEH